jgi:hypothetical protein
MTTDAATEPRCPGCGDVLYPGEVCDYCNEATLYWIEGYGEEDEDCDDD